MDDGSDYLTYALVVFALSIAFGGFVAWWKMQIPVLPKLGEPLPTKIDPQKTAATLAKYERAQLEQQQSKRRGER